MKSGNIITFYSYKGGTGRTFLMANVAALLSKWGYRVLSLDWDLEAPGLHYYFKPWLKRAPQQGLLEFIDAYSRNEQPSWRDYLTDLKLPGGTNRLSFIFAGALNDTYSSRVQRLNWDTLYSDQNFGSWLEALRTEWKHSYDFVLVDSRTGITDIGGICTVQLPDVLVCVFTPNSQSLEGAVDVATRAIEGRKKLPFDRARFLAIPVLARFDAREEKKLSEEWMAIVGRKVDALLSSWRHQTVDVTDLLYMLMVPYYSYWSFGEGLPVITDARTDPESINYNFHTLASLLAHRGDSTNNLVLARDTYVLSASQRVSPEDAARMLASDSRQLAGHIETTKTRGKDLSFGISPPTKDDRRYEYRIEFSGLALKGYLTYELPTPPSDERSLIVVNGSSTLIGALSDWQREEYSLLIRSTNVQPETRGAYAKHLVNQLANGKKLLPNTRIAVHRFGAVPVYVLPEKYNVTYFDRTAQVQIGIFPSLSGRQPMRHNYFNATKIDFLRSLGVGLGVIFQRYLEDIGEAMFDVQHQLNLPNTLERTKDIEAILAESLKSKLDMLIPSEESLKNPRTENEFIVSELFRTHTDWILTADYARRFALFFLNELYRNLGVESRSDYYLAKFKDAQDRFERLLGVAHATEARDSLSVLTILSKAISSYVDKDLTVLWEIDAENEPLWVRRFTQFAKFVSALNERSLLPTAGRLFISYSRDTIFGENVADQIEKYCEERFGSRVAILKSSESFGGSDIKNRLRADIWQCDTILEVVPTGDDRSGNKYSWVAQTAEYGLLLGKRVAYLLEQGVDETDILASLNNGYGSLIPSDARVPERLRERMRDSFLDCMQQTFPISEPSNKLNDIVIWALDEGQKSIEKRQRDILVGFVKTFPENVRRTFRHIQALAPDPKNMSKDSLAKRLVEQDNRHYGDVGRAAKAITNAWNQAKRRRLLISTKPMSLLNQREGRYSGNLHNILRVLQPDMNKTLLQQEACRILEAKSRI